MIPVVDIVKSMRYELKDMQGTKISDFELIEAINQAASLLYGRLSDRYIHVGLKKHVFSVGTTGSTALPIDFVRVYQVFDSDGNLLVPTTGNTSVTGAYRVMNDTFFAPTGSYNLEYYYTPLRVTSLADNLDIPNSLRPYIEQLSIIMHNGELARAEEIILVLSHNLGGNELSHYPDAMVQNVTGGKV